MLLLSSKCGYKSSIAGDIMCNLCMWLGRLSRAHTRPNKKKIKKKNLNVFLKYKKFNKQFIIQIAVNYRIFGVR